MRHFVLWPMVVSLAGSVSLPAGEDLLMNGDFSADAEHWLIQVDNKHDGSIKVEAGTLVVRRVLPGYFMRAYQDVSVTPGHTYLLSYRMKMEGHGFARAHVNIGGPQGWKGAGTAYGPLRKACDWRTDQIYVFAAADVDRLRINLSATGKQTTAWYDDLSLTDVSAAGQDALSPRFDTDVTLDGKLDDPAWAKALKLGSFRVTGQPEKQASPPSEVLLGVRGDDLYIGYRLAEPEVEKMQALNREDGPGVCVDDCVETFLSLDRKHYCQFMVNSLGCKGALRKARSADFNGVWHSKGEDRHAPYAGDWAAAAAVVEREWSVEIRINLNDLFPGPQAQAPVLYSNFCRHRTTGKEACSNWAGLVGSTNSAPEQFKPIRLSWTKKIAAEEGHATASRRLRFTKRLGRPDLLIAGKPVGLTMKGDVLPLPGAVTFVQRGVEIDEGVKKLVETALCLRKGRTIEVELGLWRNGDAPEGTSQAETARLKSDEAFALSVEKDRARVTGRTRQGVLRGLATLALLGSDARSRPSQSIPCLSILDAPRMAVRGWQLGGKEKEMLKRQIDILYLLRYNTIQFPLHVYQGQAPFPFESHPAIGKGVPSRADWLEVADYARARSIRAVPTFHCWARAGFIVNKPGYWRLAENQIAGAGTSSRHGHDKNLCSSNPECYKLVFDLLGEIIDALKVTDIHIAFDELHYDDMVTCPRCRIRNKKPSEYIIETVTRTAEFCRSKGARLWLYADMFDPNQNGRQIDISGPELLAKLPKDVVLQDWKYGGTGPYLSIKMFKDAGFTTVGSPWQTPGNVAGIVSSLHEFGGAGLIGTSWNTTVPEEMPPELVTNLSLGAYLSWSPEDCALANFPFVPAVLYQQVAYRFGRELPVARGSRAVSARTGLTTGDELADALGFPPGCVLGFLTEPLTNYRGVTLTSFNKGGPPAGIVVKSKGSSARLLLNGKARHITFLHALSKQPYDLDMHGMRKEYAGAVPGTYVVHYADGSKESLTLRFRRDINGWNDRLLAPEADPGLYGTVGGLYHVNIPCLTWTNPHPGKELDALEILPGNRAGLDLVLLGAALD